MSHCPVPNRMWPAASEALRRPCKSPDDGPNGLPAERLNRWRCANAQAEREEGEHINT